ncbi:MAG: hypothetical protein ACXW6V_18300 [Candidatus Binatia bacterium]
MNTHNGVQQKMIRVVASALLVLGGALVGVGCEREGAVEKAGKQVDKTVEEAKDKLNPEGPVEKAGKQVDKAVEEAKGK